MERCMHEAKYEEGAPLIIINIYRCIAAAWHGNGKCSRNIISKLPFMKQYIYISTGPTSQPHAHMSLLLQLYTLSTTYLNFFLRPITCPYFLKLIFLILPI